MEKVKIFTRGFTSNLVELELEVNAWLLENDKKIKIISRHVTGGAGANIKGEAFLNCTIAIFYRPAKKK